ncbi:hypothetical protein J7L68_07915 [bacterium]|nr:hypothetical protein [bacterium]
MNKYTKFVILFALLWAGSLYAISSSSVYFVPGGCLRCWEYSLDLKFSGDAIAPHFAIKYNWVEFYFGANLTGTSENLTAVAEKYKIIESFTYLAEVDSYALDISAYFIEPEIGARFYFAPTKQTSPYIDIGAFWAIPIFHSEYSESFTHFDTTGTITSILQNSTEGKPQTYVSGLYQLGLSANFGLHYRVNNYVSFYGEFGARGLIMGADLKYEYLSERFTPQLSGQNHLWSGSSDFWGLTAGGAAGMQIYF